MAAIGTRAEIVAHQDYDLYPLSAEPVVRVFAYTVELSALY